MREFIKGRKEVGRYKQERKEELELEEGKEGERERGREVARRGSMEGEREVGKEEVGGE